MTEPFVEPSLGRLYDRKDKIPAWPFVVGAVLVVGFGAMLLANQAYRPPYLDRTTMQSLQVSAGAIALRVIPLALIVFAALYLGITRRWLSGRELWRAGQPHGLPGHEERLAQITLELNDVTRDLVAEGRRVRADAIDRAVARRQARLDAEATEP